MQRPMESLILLDQLLYVRELTQDGVTAQLVPLFDEALSPRCIAILAAATSSSSSWTIID